MKPSKGWRLVKRGMIHKGDEFWSPLVGMWVPISPTYVGLAVFRGEIRRKIKTRSGKSHER